MHCSPLQAVLEAQKASALAAGVALPAGPPPLLPPGIPPGLTEEELRLLSR